MKLILDLDNDQMDNLFIVILKDIIDTQNNGYMHPDDIKLSKKVKKSAKFLLEYYGG
jgi:hypothetical protein